MSSFRTITITVCLSLSLSPFLATSSVSPSFSLFFPAPFFPPSQKPVHPPSLSLSALSPSFLSNPLPLRLLLASLLLFSPSCYFFFLPLFCLRLCLPSPFLSPPHHLLTLSLSIYLYLLSIYLSPFLTQ